jgi:hypothetical protein
VIGEESDEDERMRGKRNNPSLRDANTQDIFAAFYKGEQEKEKEKGAKKDKY